MNRISHYDTSPSDEPIYPSVPWPGGRDAVDAEAPDPSGIAEDSGDDDGAIGRRAFATSVAGIPRRRDHI